MGDIKIGSVNCRGLSSDKIKRRDIFLNCRNNYDITFLIDTHCTKEVERYWAAEWGYTIKFSSFSSNSRGVAILFRNSFKLNILNELQDPNGNFLMIDCEINDNRVTLAAIYGPNNDDPRFFHNIKNKLESLGNV